MASYSSLPPVGYEMEPEEKDQEMRIEFFLEAFRRYISQTVDYKDLMLFEYFSPDQRRKFRNLAKNADNAADVTDQMVETILLMKDKPNRYLSLVRLLSSVTKYYEKVLPILKGEMMPSNGIYQKTKIQKVMKAIDDTEVYEDIVCSLIQRHYISCTEIPRLLNTERNSSIFEAAVNLIVLLADRQECWYSKIILCLIESCQAYLAEKVDSDVYQKILKYKVQGIIPESAKTLTSEDQFLEFCEDFGQSLLTPIARKSSLQDITFRSNVRTLDKDYYKGELGSLGNIRIGDIPELPYWKDRYFFMCYSSYDIDKLLSILQDLEHRFSLPCIIGDRDFEPGQMIIDCILDGLKRSMMVLMFLSPNFLQSRYCKFDSDLALVMSMETGENCIIPILLEPCEIPVTIKDLTYIDATVPGIDIPARIVSALIQGEADCLPYSETSSFPEEILSMDENSISLYKKALTEGKEAINNIRVMIVGHCGVGKTTLTKRLFGETVDVNEDIASTNGIDVHIKRCKVRLTDANWLPVAKENYQETFYNRFASMISEFSKNAELQQSGTDVKSSVKEITSDADKSCNITSVKTSIKKKQTDDPDSKREFKQQENKYESLLYERESNGNKKAADLHLKEIIEDIKNRCTEDSSKDIADLSLWDFAGQYVFYGTHQIFLSRRAIYLLVTDLSQQVDSVVHDDCYIDSSGETRCKISDFVTFWLNSIHTFCASGKSREPPVILVGTFADKLIEGKKQELADEFFDKLRLSLAESEAFVHLTDAEFMLDNSIIDPNVEKLKREIVMTATKQSYWGELYPARWAILERSLMEFKERGHTVLEKKVLEDTNKNMPLPIETSEELELFLRFHHEAGFILYFSDGKLKDFILLQPQWLADALKSLITARKFCAKDQELGKLWVEFSKTGILERDLIDAVWSAGSPFHEHKDLILEFMEKLGIIARPRQCAGHRNDDVEFYVAPCVLKQTVPDSLIMLNCGDCRSTTKLCFTTPSRIIPVQMFNKLLAECITKWPISKQNGQYLMFCGCGVFDLTDMHEIFVYLRDNVIQIWINTYSSTDLDRDLCLNVRDYITESLHQSVRGSCEIETYVTCPESPVNETQCMWKVDDLSKKTEIRCNGHGRRHAVRTSEILKYWVPNITDNDVFTAAFLKQTPNEKQLSRMAQKIGKEFRSLGFELGMSRVDLDHIDMDEKNRTPVDKITAMLSHWLKKSACDATFEELKRAMIKTGIEWKNVLTGL